jgi:Mce-associated membrane protein
VTGLTADDDVTTEPAAGEVESPESEGTSAAASSRSRTPRRLLVLIGVLAVLTAVAIGVAVWQGLEVREDSRVADARSEAPAAAERAATAMLSYDYRRLAEDRERAANYLTDSYGKEYLKVYTTLEKQKDGAPGLAVQTKAVVKASVLGSGVVDADEDTVRVVVYVNQNSTKAGAEPQIFQNRVTMTMKRQDGRWLVDQLKSY